MGGVTVLVDVTAGVPVGELLGVGVGVEVFVGVSPGGVGVGVGVGVAVGVPRHKTTPLINSFLVTDTKYGVAPVEFM